MVLDFLFVDFVGDCVGCGDWLGDLVCVGVVWDV